ncbi:MAG: periplasmic heavy metal sensor [Candidatus Brocadiia bacterium]
MSMNKNTILSIVLIFSLAFNIAFAGIWVYNIAYVEPKLEQARQKQETEKFETPAQLVLEKWENIGLKPDQRKTLVNLRGKLHEQFKEDKADVEQAREDLLSLLQKTNSDPEAIEKAHQKLAREQQELRQSVMKNLMHVRGKLDEEQRRRFIRMLHRPRGRRPRGHHNHTGRPGMRGRSPRHRNPDSAPKNNNDKDPF